MAGIALSTIGAKFSYVVENVAGTRPVSGYIHIPDISDIPEIDSEPDTIETTTLDNKVYRTYIDGLKDTGGSVALTANFTDKLFEIWQDLYDAYIAAEKDGKRTWFCIDIPDFSKAAFFTGNPSPIGIPALSTNSLVTKDVYITPTGEPVWETKPTYAIAP